VLHLRASLSSWLWSKAAWPHGASIFKLLEVSRHRSVETLPAYVKRADLFQDHAGAAFL